MSRQTDDGDNMHQGSVDPRKAKRRSFRRRRSVKAAGILVGAAVVAGLVGTYALGNVASDIKSHLEAVADLVPSLKEDISENRPEQALEGVNEIRFHTAAAKAAADSPLWTLASSVPGLGQNVSAISEVARSADDVANLGLEPLVNVFGTLDWNSLLPSGSGTNLEPLKAAAPAVSSAAQAVRLSADRLEQIDENTLLPQVARPLGQAQEQLNGVSDALDVAADAARITPSMMGSDAQRNYLLMIQNNAEARASGGIPGALAVLTLDRGSLSMGAQSTAGQVGVITPTVPVDREQQHIYSARLGKFMQDVNLTPDFPTAASTAQAMWERKTGQRVDGVLSIDPVALSYILDATGPVELRSPELLALAEVGLPTRLTGQNVVETLLSSVYGKIEQPELQDAYFAGVAQEIFAVLSDGRADAPSLISGITRGAAEGRVLAWSAHELEQQVLFNYPLSGSISGPSISPAEFGVYFNDGTGAKMDFYVKRSVQLVRGCPKDGYEETRVRVTSTNTAPANAATALPSYVTGDGAFGVPSGSVQTNVVAYGPALANVETAAIDGQRTDFAPYLHENRPVGIVAVRLAPGESKTVEFTFGKIVQHTEPNLRVTPTVQHVKDVTLPTENSPCG